MLLRPLPHADGERLVYLRHSAERAGIENALFSVPEIIDYRLAGALTGIAEFSSGSFNLTARGEPQQILAGIVTGTFFGVMGLGPEIGRVFEGLLYGVAPNDPLTLGVVGPPDGRSRRDGSLGAAVRAPSVQPVEALRAE